MELGAAEVQPSECQNHHRTKIKSGIGKQNFSIPLLQKLYFWEEKTKKT
jgi:hypothetical protein